jgi:hypothetical protein
MVTKRVIMRTWPNSDGKKSVSGTIPQEAAAPLGIEAGDSVLWQIDYNPTLVTVRKATPQEIAEAEAKKKKREK